MARKQSPVLTEGELEIMEVLWDRREATVRDVTDTLSRRRPVAYSTVLTMLRILKNKAYAAYRKEGRAFVFFPLVSRREARSRALGNLIGKFFGGSAVALAQNLVDDTEIDVAELERLQSQVQRNEDDKS